MVRVRDCEIRDWRRRSELWKGPSTFRREESWQENSWRIQWSDPREKSDGKDPTENKPEKKRKTTARQGNKSNAKMK